MSSNFVKSHKKRITNLVIKVELTFFVGRLKSLIFSNTKTAFHKREKAMLKDKTVGFPSQENPTVFFGFRPRRLIPLDPYPVTVGPSL